MTTGRNGATYAGEENYGIWLFDCYQYSKSYVMDAKNSHHRGGSLLYAVPKRLTKRLNIMKLAATMGVGAKIVAVILQGRMFVSPFSAQQKNK